MLPVVRLSMSGAGGHSGRALTAEAKGAGLNSQQLLYSFSFALVSLLPTQGKIFECKIIPVWRETYMLLHE